jgi:hypothetical protein
MFAALVVCLFAISLHYFALISLRWSLCTLIRRLACLAFPDPIPLRLERNKAVLNSSPDLPLLFLFIQLVLAVILLHAATLLSPRIEIPCWDRHTALKLFPVVAINIVGLVFNTLCLREVEATFFQVIITIFSSESPSSISVLRRLQEAWSYP